MCGGKDAASARYIFTRLSPLTRALFSNSDDALLKYLDDDGLSVEPEFYVPIIPTVLVCYSYYFIGWCGTLKRVVWY